METDLSIPPALRPIVQRGSLYIVSLPIGHIEDITVRALRVLKEVSLIAAENASVTGELLRHYSLVTPLISCRPYSRAVISERVIERLVAGDSVAFVSDAGTPCIADPGQTIVRMALATGAPVIAIPGPAAALAALVVSSLPGGRFAFDGFPPRSRSDRAAFFAGLSVERRTLVLYESRSHLRGTLRALRETLGPSRQVVIARNLTKASETIFYGSLEQAVAGFNKPNPGEYTLVIAGAAF